jgi:hypothetical protein
MKTLESIAEVLLYVAGTFLVGLVAFRYTSLAISTAEEARRWAAAPEMEPYADDSEETEVVPYGCTVPDDVTPVSWLGNCWCGEGFPGSIAIR